MRHGVKDEDDNCSLDPNPNQTDPDGDQIGSVCDNCPDVYNPDQKDCDVNGTGRACDDLASGEWKYLDKCDLPTEFHAWVNPMDLVVLPDSCTIR